MKLNIALGLAACALALSACATDLAAQRKAYMKTFPTLQAAIDSELDSRAPAKCQTDNKGLDRPSQPLTRIPPFMPPGADRSGHCAITYDVNALGQTVDIHTSYCTHKLFSYDTRRSAAGWVFAAAIKDGEPVGMCSLKSRVTFQLTDERGRVLPEHVPSMGN